MERWVGKVAVVTGASAGIGEAIAEALVNAGVIVIGAARRLERLEGLAKKLASAKGKFHPVKLDITVDAEILSTFEWVNKKFGGVDILINNAGILADPKTSTLSDGSIESWRKIFDTNVIGLSICTREAIRSMKARNVDGHIVHISSVAGRKIPDGMGQYMNAYGGSKHAVHALAETLFQELVADKKKIKVSVISPGMVYTEIFDAANFKIDKEFNDLSTVTGLTPKDVADACVYVLGTPPNVVIRDLLITPVDSNC